MKMIDTETGHEMVEVSGHDKKEYASKGVAGTGLGLGIAGTALWLLSGGLGGGLFGNRMGAAGAVAAGVEKEDKCELINGMWSLAFNGQTARCNDRHQIEAEMFGLYKSQIDADFGLYKSQRDGFDVTNARVSELEKEVAVLRATRPYQDALIQAAITRVAEQADFNLFRRTCRMITGEVVLPNTPTVTGYPAYNPYSCLHKVLRLLLINLLFQFEKYSDIKIGVLLLLIKILQL
jgi:hypothetical protein